MVFVVPNYFLEYLPKNVIATKSLFCVAYSSRTSNQNIAVRNVTHAMIFILQGDKKVILKDKTISIKSEDILLLSQGNYFMSEITDKYGDYKAILIYFDDEFILEFIKEFDISLKCKNENPIVKIRSDQMVKELIKSYQLYTDKKMQQQNNIIVLKTKEIFLHLIEREPNKICEFFSYILNQSQDRLKYILEANIDIIESVEDMAKVARITKKELRAKIKEIYQKNPKEWLKIKKLEKSSVLLKNSSRSVADIASSCSYSSSSWFSSEFKSYFGCTPKEYRIQNQQK